MKKLFSFILLISSCLFSFAQYTDNFDTCTNGAILAGRGIWVTGIGPVANDGFKTYNSGSAGEVYCNQSGAQAVYYNASVTSAQYAQVKYVSEYTDKSNGVGVCIDSVGNGNGYLWFSDPAGSYFLHVINGVENWTDPTKYELGNSWVPGHKYKLVRTATKFYFYDDQGTGEWTLDLSMYGDGDTTDATSTGGYVGISGYGASAHLHAIDDWEGGSYSTSLDAGTIEGDRTVSYGGTPSAFTNVSGATGGTGSYTYAWNYSTDADSGTWIPISSSNSLTYAPGAQIDTTYWVRSVDDGTSDDTSNVLTIYVLPYEEPGGGGSPSINYKTFPYNIIQGDSISHAQYYVVPDSACQPDWYIGQFYVNCTDSVFNGAGETYAYDTINGYTGTQAIKIDASTGMIKVKDSSKIVYGSDIVGKIKVTDTEGTNRTDTFNIYIKVAHKDSCRYIDPDASASGTTGRYNHPWVRYDAATYTTGYYYFGKRGTISATGDQMIIVNEGSPTKYIYAAAYGVGNRPVLKGSSSYTTAIMAGTYWVESSHEFSSEKIKIFDFDVYNYTQAQDNGPVYIADGAKDIELHRIKSHNSYSMANIYIRPADPTKANDRIDSRIKLYDCEVDSNTYSGRHGIKNEGAYVTFINLWGRGNTGGHFLDLSVWGGFNKAYYVYGNNEGTTAVLFRHANNILQYFYIKGTSGISITQPTETQFHPDSNVVSDGYAELSGTYWGAQYGGNILFGDDIGDNQGHSNYDTIRHVISNITSTSSAPAILAGMRFPQTATSTGKMPISHLVVDGCIFYGLRNGIYIDDSYLTNSTFVNNLFFNLTSNGLYVNSVGSGNKFYNNTFYNSTSNDLYNTLSSGSLEWKNNLYQDYNSLSNIIATNNLDIDNVTLSDYFTDYIVNDFTLKSTASLAIDVGAVGLTSTDILRNSTYNNIKDLGAYEYTVSSPGSNPTGTVLRHVGGVEWSKHYINGVEYDAKF